jgi:hypothetical protein
MSLLRHGNLVPDVVALVGLLVFCAGMHLLWLSRRDIFGWIDEFVRLFRHSVRQLGDSASATAAPVEPVDGKLQRKHTVRIALGVLLAFLLAPMLITLGLGF